VNKVSEAALFISTSFIFVGFIYIIFSPYRKTMAYLNSFQ